MREGEHNETNNTTPPYKKHPNLDFFDEWPKAGGRASGSWRDPTALQKYNQDKKWGEPPLWCDIKAPAGRIALVIEEKKRPATEQETRLVVDSAGPRFLFIASAISPPLLKCINGNSWSWGSARTDATCIHLLNMMSARDQQDIESQVEG